MREGWTAAETCRRLQDAGADVVGMNCARGRRRPCRCCARSARAVTCHVAALPVPYRTTQAEPTFQSLTDPRGVSGPDGRPFPTALDPFLCNRYEIGEFGKEALALGARYLGVCCGAGPHHVRSLAERSGAAGRSRYSPDMSKHILSAPTSVCVRTIWTTPAATIDRPPPPVKPPAAQ